MPTCGKPDFNWYAPNLEVELKRWERVVKDNFTVHSTKEEGKAAFMRSWLGDRGAEIIDCYHWTDEEWGDHKLLLTRLKENIKPTSRIMIQRYKYELHRCIQKPDQTFTQFFGILKSKVELAKAFDHKGCKHAACKQECVSDQMMSSIYIGAKDQRVRDKIDDLADDDHSVDKYREIAEMLESKHKNADTFQADQAASINAIRKYQSNKIQSGGKCCGRCGKSHP